MKKKLDLKKDDKLRNLDKEVYKLVKRKKSEKYMLISSILEELESNYNIEIQEFQFKNKLLNVRLKEKDWVCIDLSKDL